MRKHQKARPWPISLGKETPLGAQDFRQGNSGNAGCSRGRESREQHRGAMAEGAAGAMAEGAMAEGAVAEGAVAEGAAGAVAEGGEGCGLHSERAGPALRLGRAQGSAQDRLSSGTAPAQR